MVRRGFVLGGLLAFSLLSSTGFGQILVEPSGKETTLKLGGLLQVQADFGDRGDGRFTTADDRFYLRRARVNVTGKFLEEFDFKLEVDASGNLGNNAAISSNLRVQMTDGYVNWNKDRRANIRGGQFKTGYGYEQLFLDAKLFTIERSLVNDRLTLGRQIGAQASGEFWEGRFSYAAGIFNGSGLNNSANDNNSFLTVGRASVIALQRKTGNAYSLSVGANYFQSDDKDLSQPSDLGLPFVTFTGHRSGEGVDSQFQYGRLEVWAEYLREKFEPENSPTFQDFVAEGWYTQVSYFVIPAKVQVLGKFETFDPITRTGGNETDTWTAGVSYFFKGDDLCFRFNYLHSDVPLLEAQNKVLLRMQVVF